MGNAVLRGARITCRWWFMEEARKRKSTILSLMSTEGSYARPWNHEYRLKALITLSAVVFPEQHLNLRLGIPWDPQKVAISLNITWVCGFPSTLPASNSHLHNHVLGMDTNRIMISRVFCCWILAFLNDYESSFCLLAYLHYFPHSHQ